MTFYQQYGKRLFDLALTVPALIVFAPLFAVLALLIRWQLGSPVLFRQERPGLLQRPFTLIKFRSMSNARDASGALLPDAQRLPRFGQLLRKTSLDELPELWNIVKGDMSLVGPRPLLMAYLPYYTPREQTRHHVRPGLTGYAQIHGRSFVRWDQRLEWDARYVEQLSFPLDLSILLKTVWQVVRARDIVNVPGTVQQGFVAERQARLHQESTP